MRIKAEEKDREIQELRKLGKDREQQRQLELLTRIRTQEDRLKEQEE